LVSLIEGNFGSVFILVEGVLAAAAGMVLLVSGAGVFMLSNTFLTGVDRSSVFLLESEAGAEDLDSPSGFGVLKADREAICVASGTGVLITLARFDGPADTFLLL